MRSFVHSAVLFCVLVGGQLPRAVAQAAQAGCPAAPVDQSSCPAAQEFARLPQSASTLCVQVKLQKGRLMVDPQLTVFTPSTRFRCTPKVLSQESAKSILISDLDRIFAGMPQFYWFGLTNSLQKKDQANTLNDADTNTVRQSTSDWMAFLKQYNQWFSKLHTAGIGTAFSKYMASLNAEHQGDLGALALEDDETAFPPVIGINSKSGVLKFSVADPISSWVDPLDPSTAGNPFTVATQAPLSSKEAQDKHIQKLVQVLKPLQGHLWRRAEILDLLVDFYFPQGYTQPQIFLQDQTVTIQESVSISRIVICPKNIKPVTGEIVLYNLLSTGDFSEFLRNGGQFGTVGVPDPCLVYNYAATHDPVLLNYNTFQVQQGALSTLGFDAAVTPSDSQGVATLLVRQGSSAPKATSGTTGNVPKSPATANVSSTSQLSGDRTSRMPAPLPPVAPVDNKTITDNTADPDSATPMPKLLNNFLGGGVDYSPGQGVRPFALYSRQRFLSDQGTLTVKAGANGKALGELDYSSDYAFFGSLHHDLSLRLTGSSDFQQKRFLFGAATDERRTGGLAHASYELFRDLDQMQLQVFIEGRQTRVLLSPSGQSQLTTNLSTLDLGASFVLDRMTGRFGRHVELNPTVRLGVALTNNEPSYQTGTFTGSFQQNLPHLYQLHFNGKAQTASGGTPIFELPSFGGDGSVRGFRQDDGLGRRVLSLQSELWSPIPGVTNSSGTIGQFFHRNVWLAGFFDAGGAFQSIDAVHGAREGTGIGARVNYKLVIFKLDWAYGFGTGRTGDGRGRVYFSIANWLPL